MYFDIDEWNPDFYKAFKAWLKKKGWRYDEAKYSNDEDIPDAVYFPEAKKEFSSHIYTDIVVDMKRTPELTAFLRKWRRKVCIDLSVYNTTQLFRHPFFDKTYTFKDADECAIKFGFNEKGDMVYSPGSFVIEEYNSYAECRTLLSILQEIEAEGLFQYKAQRHVESLNEQMQRLRCEGLKRLKGVVDQKIRFKQALEKAKITDEEKEKLLWHDEDHDVEFNIPSAEDTRIFAGLKRVFNTCAPTTPLFMLPMLLVKEGVAPPSWMDTSCRMVRNTLYTDTDGNTLEMLCIIHGVQVPDWAWHDADVKNHKGYTAAMLYVDKHAVLPTDTRLKHGLEVKDKAGKTILDHLAAVCGW